MDDPAHCDSLGAPSGVVEELGSSSPPFTPDSLVGGTDVGITFTPACAASDTGNFNWQVTMVNLSGLDFADVWYVADPETSISNWDGFINGQFAFKIDAVGANTPLVSESISADGIFQFGEIWVFTLDDFSNSFGFPADAFLSLGVGGDSAELDGSTGSIITAEIPEPGPLALLSAALVGIAFLRRRTALA